MLKKSRSTLLLFLACILTGVLLAGCNLGGDLPVCDPEAINLAAVYPTYRRPAEPLVSPMIEWSYYWEADGTGATCDPESQHIRFGSRTFDEAGESILTVLVERDLSSTDRLYTPGIRLEPAGHYFWEVTWFGASGTLQKSRFVPFNAGPVCEREDLRPPVILSVPDGATVPADATISWEYPGVCIPESVEVDVSSTAAFEASSTDYYFYDFAIHGLTGWETCREYYWRVASTMLIPPTDIEFAPRVELPSPLAAVPLEFEFTGFMRSDFTPVRSFYVTGDACPLPPDGFGPAGSLPALPDLPLVRLRENANCRSGPTTEYPVLDVLIAGAELPIRGRNQAGDSWLVEDVNINRTCWVFSGSVDVSGDTGGIGVIDPDPPAITLPTDTPVPPYNCAQFTPNTCEVENHPCQWLNNACVNK